MITRDFPMPATHRRRVAADKAEEFLKRLRGLGYVSTQPCKKSIEGDYCLDSMPCGGFRVIVHERPQHKDLL